MCYSMAVFIQKMHDLSGRDVGKDSSEIRYVAMATKVVYSYCGAHVVQSYCKESSISEFNLAEVSFLIIADQNSVEFMTSSLD